MATTKRSEPAAKTPDDFVYTPGTGRGRGRARPQNLHPAVAAHMDQQSDRLAARRQKLREEPPPLPPGAKSTLSQRVRAARLYRERTQAQVAEALGVSRPTVAFWESDDPGLVTTPRPSQIKAMAEFLQVPPEFFIRDDFGQHEAWKAIEMFGTRSQDLQARADPRESSPESNSAALAIKELQVELQRLRREIHSPRAAQELPGDVLELAQRLSAVPPERRAQLLATLNAVLTSMNS